MQSYRCTCGNRIFFDNSLCVACGRELGFCPVCRTLVALLRKDRGHLQCGNPECNAGLAKCFNYVEHNVCNRCVLESSAAAGAFCDCCRFNETIPDLSIAGNCQKWHRLEAAKRRLFYDLDQLGLPYGMASDGINPPLRFDFKADIIPANNFWRPVGDAQRVFTGHNAGRITINIREADDVEREQLRVDLGEAKRTLIGHFRHEIGHYYWDMLVKGRREDEFRAAFGDHERPSYGEALDAYYRNGAPSDWSQHFISAYAAMHPREDFAETWASYLDMVSTLDTAQHIGMGGETDPIHADIGRMLARYQDLGVAFNEINRNMGLLDVVPEVFVAPVIAKLGFIHQLVRLGAKRIHFGS